MNVVYIYAGNFVTFQMSKSIFLSKKMENFADKTYFSKIQRKSLGKKTKGLKKLCTMIDTDSLLSSFVNLAL